MAKVAKRKYDDRARLADYRAVFSGDAGTRVFNDLLARHYVLGSTFSDQPTIMAHAEGQREVILQILRFMQMKPSDILEARASMLAQFELEDSESDAGI